MDKDTPDHFHTISQAAKGPSMLQVLESYWNDLRGDLPVPAHAAIDPVQIDAALPYSFIVERVAPGVGRLRVSGRKINELAQTETRGMPLSVFFNDDAFDPMADYLERCFSDPAIVEVPVLSPRSLTRPKLTGRLLLLPLAGANGLPNRALGALLVDGATGRTARRFSIDPTQDIRCERLSSAAPAVTRLSDRTARPLQDALYAGETKGPTKRPALKLIVDNT